MNSDTEQFDTSNRNSYVDNKVGVRPDGTRAPNGVDFWWDEEGTGNCWQGNVGPNGARPTSDPATLPTCAAGGSAFSTGNPAKQTFQVPCATWNPTDNTDPPGCDWFNQPPKPR
jgi:hypothetical protein